MDYTLYDNCPEAEAELEAMYQAQKDTAYWERVMGTQFVEKMGRLQATGFMADGTYAAITIPQGK